MMRRIQPPRLTPVVAQALAITAVCAAVTGCGDSEIQTPHLNRSGRATRITKAQAVAYTRAVILHVGDLPQATVKKSDRNAQNQEMSSKARGCLRHAGEVSPELALATHETAPLEWHLHDEAVVLSSNVTVMPRVGLVARNDAVYRSRRAIRCLAEFLSSTLLEAVGGRAEIGPVVESRLPFPLPGVRSGFGWRIALSMMVGASERDQLIDYAGEELRHVQVYFDVFGFTSGPAEIGLLAYGIPTPVPKQIEDRAVALLYGRAMAHRLNP